MNPDELFDRRMNRWFADGPAEAPDTVLRDVLAGVAATSQRTSGLRRPSTIGRGRLLTAGAAVTAAVALSLSAVSLLVRTPSSIVGQPATPMPTLAPSPGSASSSIDTARWPSFRSERFGYSISYPDGWLVEPATGPWLTPSMPAGIDFGLESFVSDQTDGFQFGVASQRIPAGVSAMAWLAAYERNSGLLEACYPPPERMERITVGGYPAYVHGDPAACRFIEAVAIADGRAYVFLGNGFSDPRQGRPFDRALFDAFLSTVALDAASANDASG